jgi:D-beta-D-heptose 7-phosphate kinase/D-beta-D-heptose 1-phosphate adenosyltransferase
MRDKIRARADLAGVLTKRRAKGHRIVFTNGCFDLMHIGHTRYLQAARELGDLLVVGVNTDASVRSLDKEAGRPIVPEAQRAEVLAALASVDYVVLFDEPDPARLIAELQPDVLVKGGDWPPDKIIGREIVEARGGRVQTIPLVPGVSTTALVDTITRLKDPKRAQ